MSTVNLRTPAQAERRIKHLTALLREQCRRIGEPAIVREERHRVRREEMRRRGLPIPADPSGVYECMVWLETGEVL